MYNGFGGGRVFKWYCKGVFQIMLRSRVPLFCRHEQFYGVSERYIVEALRRTNEFLTKCGAEFLRRDGVVEYAGPQCYPQFTDRANANSDLFPDSRWRPAPESADSHRAGWTIPDAIGPMHEV